MSTVLLMSAFIDRCALLRLHRLSELVALSGRRITARSDWFHSFGPDHSRCLWLSLGGGRLISLPCFYSFAESWCLGVLRFTFFGVSSTLDSNFWPRPQVKPAVLESSPADRARQLAYLNEVAFLPPRISPA
jgi:hypothetical protein